MALLPCDFFVPVPTAVFGKKCESKSLSLWEVFSMQGTCMRIRVVTLTTLVNREHCEVYIMARIRITSTQPGVAGHRRPRFKRPNHFSLANMETLELLSLTRVVFRRQRLINPRCKDQTLCRVHPVNLATRILRQMSTSENIGNCRVSALLGSSMNGIVERDVPH
jgi:hypothetical protein